MRVKRMEEYVVGCPEIGDKIDFTLKTGEKVEAMAVKTLFNGTVFCSVDFLSNSYPMNRNGGTKGGYEASDLRKTLNGEILDSFPDDIREQLVPFDNGDLLTIPSEREMFGDNLYSTEDEGNAMQWEPMANRHNRVAFRNGYYEYGWLRNVADSTDFVDCDAGGDASNWNAVRFGGVRPVFIIGGGISE